MFRPLNVRREGLEVIYRAYGMLQAEAIKGHGAKLTLGHWWPGAPSSVSRVA
jgi:hypothetical protein